MNDMVFDLSFIICDIYCLDFYLISLELDL